jgi:4-diphosphocytidyl-2-C-methyl-D-erythritol kinase
MKEILIEQLLGTSHSLISPAKINLRLKVLGQKSDGYHLLSMLNATVSLHDEISVEFCADKKSSSLQVIYLRAENVDPGVLNIQSNLATKAAQAYLEHFEIQLGTIVKLKKNIPIGAGLGGGSSNAAAILCFLNNRFRSKIKETTSLSDPEIDAAVSDLAVHLGADVPFFLKGGLANVQGIGEQVVKLNDRFLQGTSCLIIKPAVNINTGSIFGLYRSNNHSIGQNRDDKLLEFCSRLSSFPEKKPIDTSESLYSQMLKLVDNDLEETVSSQSPLIRSILEELRKNQDIVAGLTGSGSAVFVLPKCSKSLNIEQVNRISALAASGQAEILSTTLLANLSE